MLAHLDLQEGLEGAGRETPAKGQKESRGRNSTISADMSRRHFKQLKQRNISTRNVRHFTCQVLVSARPG